MFLLGIGIEGAVCLQCGETAVGVGGQKPEICKTWNRRFVLEINMFRFQVKSFRGSHHGHKRCLLASNMFSFGGGTISGITS